MPFYYSDVIMSAMASQITSLTIVYSTVCSGADQRKHQSSAPLVRGFHRLPANSPHKGTVTRKMFPFDDVIMRWRGFIYWRPNDAYNAKALSESMLVFCLLDPSEQISVKPWSKYYTFKLENKFETKWRLQNCEHLIPPSMCLVL